MIDAIIIAYICFKRNKIFILLRSRPSHKRHALRTANYPQAAEALPRRGNKIALLFRLAPQNHPPSTTSYTIRSLLSSHLSPGLAPTAAAFGRQALVSHGIDKRDFHAAVVQRPPHAVDIAILFQQLHRVNLAHGMRRSVRG